MFRRRPFFLAVFSAVSAVFRSKNSAVFFGGFSGAENSAGFSAVFQMIFQVEIVEDIYPFLKGNVSFWRSTSLLK